MPGSSELAIYGSLLVAGLAGSLHCIGMCGPILLSFSRVFDAAASARGESGGSGALDFVWYHAGRIWTYGVLGFLAGWAGQGVRQSSVHFGWQRPVAVAIGLVVVLTGLLLLGGIPGLRLDRLWSGCGLDKLRGVRWFRALLSGPGRVSKVLLGAVMGLLPCGLVYAMLAVVATLPGPLHAALGMLVFGLGTLPALSAVLLAGRAVPVGWRVHGTRLAGVALILVGCWMTARSLIVEPEAGCPLHPGATAGHDAQGSR
jgi:sulfite exporter TauE/SafE